MSKKLALGLALGLMGSVGSASAADITALASIGQPEFRALSEDMAAAIGYKAMTDAEPMGLIGFDVGLAVTATSLESGSIWGTVTQDSKVNTLILPKLYAKKGLPFGVDLGAYYVKVPSSNIEVWGGEVKYSILDGTMATPALAVRGSMSRLEGVDQWKVNTTGLDVSISKGILMLTPYAGIGRQWTTSTPKADAALVLNEEKFSDNKVYYGVGFSMLLVNLSLEQEKLGDVSSTTLKLGLKF